mmetsp:Transcript_8271/g.15475  ORF Transcript_8271/g.15475 Transcript_8271/m.15475 type:complete len:731 (+) Transcript_8271:1104-3296(+)
MSFLGHCPPQDFHNRMSSTAAAAAAAAAADLPISSLETDPLLQPFQLRNLTLRNRIFSTSHAPNYVDPGGMPGERYQRYHEEKAKGGLALTMFGGSSTVSPDSPSAFGQINCTNDAVIPYFQGLADAVHRHGALTMIQLTHLGWRTADDVADWLPVVAPSRVRERAHRSFPVEMDQQDIDRVVNDFGLAAKRVQLGGLDGLEVFAGGHLIDSFWSRRSNLRTDKYGGSLANRVRFALEVLEEIRRQVGPDFVVGMRIQGKASHKLKDPGWKLPGDSEDDLSHEECLEIAAIIANSGMVDFFNVNAGTIETDNKLATCIPSMYGPLAPHLEVAASFKREFKLPVLHATRIIDLSTARRAVKEGLLDMAGMTRAHIADPHIVNKLRSGQEDRIRPCVGAGYCLDRIYVGQDALCLHNAANGREHQGMPHVITPADGARQKRVVVIGGGPAGLEAARVCALRGHRVSLFEAAKELGGQVRLAQRATWRRDLGGVADWLADEVNKLGVEVHLNSYVEEEEVLQESPDIVIVATGGVPDTLGFEGPGVRSVWDVLSEPGSVGQEVLIFDDHGKQQAPSCAEQLARSGKSVELVTADRMVAQGMGALNWPIFLRNLYGLGVTLTPDLNLEAVESTDSGRCKVVLRNEYSGLAVEREVDTVIIEHGTVPCTEVFDNLRPSSSNDGKVDLPSLLSTPSRAQGALPGREGFLLFRVGDAVSCRNIHAAIYDSLRLCKDF